MALKVPHDTVAVVRSSVAVTENVAIREGMPLMGEITWFDGQVITGG